jgi:thiamine pyrophosphate-dependent acetolactate synthase large subunit-like protein
MSQTVSELLVGVLEQIGVRHIFGLIGDSLNPLADGHQDGRNYAEIFERNVGQASPLKLARGLNATWSKGGF